MGEGGRNTLNLVKYYIQLELFLENINSDMTQLIYLMFHRKTTK